jgi:hypothetical protein
MPDPSPTLASALVRRPSPPDVAQLPRLTAETRRRRGRTESGGRPKPVRDREQAPFRSPRLCVSAVSLTAGARATPVRFRIPSKRSCQCCGRAFRPLGRWNCRCEECRLLQDEDGLPPRIFADPRPEEEAKEERRKA